MDEPCHPAHKFLIAMHRTLTSVYSCSPSLCPCPILFAQQALRRRLPGSNQKPGEGPFARLLRSSVLGLAMRMQMCYYPQRELDAKRQSLVYNHHHELVEASETIGKMTAGSDKLDGTLVRLQDSFSSISELLSTLSTPVTPVNGQGGVDDSSYKDKTIFHLSTLLSLPTILKGLLTANNEGAADQLWGQ
ncbi:hypothetical protein O181_034300 [Austropuccinia psidii MF-1]|uniref:Uncharacterized protein n=1 Tax=Austropuccinia psidii MF-1 TaxID=1389203 RepID=A0A9Q3D4N0_9BASI|nr:hypothetical protein [Austropuccinia psidii MF-1]